MKSLETQINERKTAAYKAAKGIGFIHERFPEIDYFVPGNPGRTDPGAVYLSEINKATFQSCIVRQTVNGTEFAHRTLISPEKVQLLQKAAAAARAKEQAVKNYAQRVGRGKVVKANVSERLGNIGNNLARFEKRVREKRYRIQRFIQSEGLSRSEAVCNCGTSISEVVHLKKNLEFGNVNIGGVATCDSVWACPVCRAKIINKRSEELQTIYTRGRGKGLKFHLLTFTFSHSKNDNLAELYGSSSLRKGLSGAFTKFRQSRAWSKDFKPAIGYVGDVRAVEVTWGRAAGFHPHIHLVVVSQKDFNVNEWQKKLLKQWKLNCVRSGIGEPNQHGLKIDKCNSPDQVIYLAKWSVASEISSDAVKEAKNGNFSIAELESLLIDREARNDKKITLGEVAGILKSYYASMHGQKQLVYGGQGSGWKKDLGIVELSDHELTEEEYQAREESHICVMDAAIYRRFRRSPGLSYAIQEIEQIPAGVDNYSVKVVHVVKKWLHAYKIESSGKVWERSTFASQFQ